MTRHRFTAPRPVPGARRLPAVAVAATTALLLAACSGDQEAGPAAGSPAPAPASVSVPAPVEPPAPSATVDEAHNDADVAFAQAMIVHHRQAIEMARTAVPKASDPAVKELAAFVLNAQEGEVERMSGWLTAWGEPVPTGTQLPTSGTSSEGHAGHEGGMPGAMSEQEMAQLESATGAEFDRAFLQAMIPHHQGAVEIAREALAEGRNPQAKELAERIVTEQTSEIADMQDMLGS